MTRAPVRASTPICLTSLPNVRRLQALRTLHGVVLHCLTLGQAAKAFADDGGVMDEHVRPALRRDEAETLCIVEPLHSAPRHLDFLSFPASLVGHDCGVYG